MLFRNMLRKIKKSFGRYISLMLIIAIGVGFYAGIIVSVPNIKRVQSQYYDDMNLMDIKINSTLGLTDDDITALKQLDNVKDVVGTYSENVLSGEDVIRVHAIEDNINKLELIDGKLPEKEDECLADATYYKIGDKITIEETQEENSETTNDNIKVQEFTVVGTVNSPLYTGTDYGSVNIGNGSLKSYIFIPKEDFNYEAYTEIYITANKEKSDDPYSKNYKNLINGVIEEINSIKDERQAERYNQIVGDAQAKLDEAKSELQSKQDEAESKLQEARDEITKNEAELEKGQNEINSNKTAMNKKFENAQAEINTNRSTLNSNKQTLETKKIESEKQFSDAEAQKSELENNKTQVESALTALETSIQAINAKLQSAEISEEEKTALNQQLSALKSQQETLQQQQAQITAGIQQIDETITSGRAELEAAEKQINDGLAKLDAAQKELDSKKKSANAEIASAQAQIDSGRAELEKGKQELAANEEEYNTQIKDAQIKIDDAQAEVNKIEEAKWYVFDRNDEVSGYKELDTMYNQIATIANIIPLFFILIIVLMTSNTMARMIIEERGEMGTFCSLGISSGKIIFNYILYVLSSTIIGCIIGYFAGTYIIPPLVYTCLPANLPELTYQYNASILSSCMLVACIIMTAVTVVACKKELKNAPATLLRPVAPKKGKKILLERIGFLWKRISFSWKVTLRNIMRYKKRGVMTLIGTAGCTFIILMGFALKDSINGVGDKQFTEISKYDNMLVLDSSTDTITESLHSVLDGKITDPILINQAAYDIIDKDENTIDIYVIAPQNADESFYNYFNLRDQNHEERINLTDDGVIITPKIAEKLDVKVGDEMSFYDADGNEYKAKITGIAENYLSNYIYMTSNFYTQIFGETPKYNIIVSKNAEDKNQLANDLLSSGKIISINFADDLMEKANNEIQGLNNIVVLLVIVASLLAFTVLYNLTSINISERTRDIATLKVLGFRDGEANQYIYRETMCIVIIGIIIGLAITPFLHQFIISFIEGDSMVFLKEIEPLSFVYAGTLTLIFAIIMEIVTYFKLKKINMVESLKSVD